jgi:hypothetical protein
VAALGFFRASAESEQANTALIAAVAAFLKRAEHDPGLRFETPGRGGSAGAHPFGQFGKAANVETPAGPVQFAGPDPLRSAGEQR